MLGPALLVVALTGRSLRGSFGCGLAFGLALFVPLLSWLVNEAWYAWAALAGALAVIFAVLAIGQRLLLRLPFWPAAVAGWWVCVEGSAGPVALRLSLGPAGDEPVGRAGRALGRGGRRAAAHLPARPDRRHDRAGGAVLSRGSDPPQTPPDPRGAPAPRSSPGRDCPSPRTPWGGLPAPGPPGGPALAAVVTAGLVLAGGLLPVDPTGGAPTAQVAAIQGNVPRARNLPQLLNDTQVTQNHAAATLKLAAQVKAGRLPAPALVVWPENCTDLDPFQNPFIYSQLAGTVAAVGQPGPGRRGPAGPAAQRRPALGARAAARPRCTSSASWCRSASTSRSAASSPASVRSRRCSRPNFTPGHPAVVFDVGKIRLGDVICYEVGFDNLVRSEVTAGANLLAVQSNDADFEIDGQLGETEQQTAMARIRAIESDRAVVYASTTGESTIIAPDGALIAHSGVWRQAILDARVPLVSYRTLADRVGAWPEYVIIMLTVLALAWALLRSRSRRERARPTIA